MAVLSYLNLEVGQHDSQERVEALRVIDLEGVAAQFSDEFSELADEFVF